MVYWMVGYMLLQEKCKVITKISLVLFLSLILIACNSNYLDVEPSYEFDSIDKQDSEDVEEWLKKIRTVTDINKEDYYTLDIVKSDNIQRTYIYSTRYKNAQIKYSKDDGTIFIELNNENVNRQHLFLKLIYDVEQFDKINIAY